MEELMQLLQGGGGAAPSQQPGHMPPEGGKPPGLPSQQPGIPPQMAMILQALEGIGASAAQSQGGGMPHGQPPQMSAPEAQLANNEAAPLSDEDMISQVHDQMGQEAPEEHQWEGEEDGTPSPKDLKHIEEMPTDGVLQSFFEHFPTWADQNIQQEGGRGATTPDDDSEMMVDEDEITETYKGRKTKVDDR